MNFIKPEDVVWKEVKYLRQGETRDYDYTFLLPVPLADWDVFDYWERERIESMRTHLKQGDVLFDIGTEQGWCNLAYAQMVGPRNIVLIEPTPEFWGNIYRTWVKNIGGDKPPLALYDGLFSDKTTDKRDIKYISEHWNDEALGDLVDRNSYRYIHEHGDTVPQITLDDYVSETGIVPDALTMDTEGSELLILRGAEKTLTKHHPKLWVSIHPELGERDYGIKKEDTIGFLESLGYTGEHLATDHEEHWYFK